MADHRAASVLAALLHIKASMKTCCSTAVISESIWLRVPVALLVCPHGSVVERLMAHGGLYMFIYFSLLLSCHYTANYRPVIGDSCLNVVLDGSD